MHQNNLLETATWKITCHYFIAFAVWRFEFDKLCFLFVYFFSLVFFFFFPLFLYHFFYLCYLNLLLFKSEKKSRKLNRESWVDNGTKGQTDKYYTFPWYSIPLCLLLEISFNLWSPFFRFVFVFRLLFRSFFLLLLFCSGCCLFVHISYTFYLTLNIHTSNDNSKNKNKTQRERNKRTLWAFLNMGISYWTCKETNNSSRAN